MIVIAILVAAGWWFIHCAHDASDVMLWMACILAVTWAVDVLRSKFDRWV